MNNPILPQAIKVCQFDNFNVSFTDTAYLNATEIAKSFGKQVRDYLINNRTTDYINAITEYFAETGNPVTAKNQLVIIKKGGNDKNAQGTWLHPKLAIDFARWLNPRFAVWCDMQIAKLLNLDENAKPSPKLTNTQAHQIQKAIKQKCQYNKLHYQTLYHAIYNAFGVKSYKDLLASDFDKALVFIQRFRLQDDIHHQIMLAHIQANQQAIITLKEAECLLDWALGKVQNILSINEALAKSLSTRNSQLP